MLWFMGSRRVGHDLSELNCPDIPLFMGFPGVSVGQESACNAGDAVLIPGSGRSPGGGDGNPLQYSCLKNPMGRGASPGTVHWVTESDMTEAAEQTGMFGSVQLLSMYLYLYLVLFTLISLYLCLSVSLSSILLAVFFLLGYEFGCMCVCKFFPEFSSIFPKN